MNYIEEVCQDIGEILPSFFSSTEHYALGSQYQPATLKNRKWSEDAIQVGELE